MDTRHTREHLAALPARQECRVLGKEAATAVACAALLVGLASFVYLLHPNALYKHCTAQLIAACS
jgi:hypothetical protein